MIFVSYRSLKVRLIKDHLFSPSETEENGYSSLEGPMVCCEYVLCHII